jgi:hypothetical protein
VLAKNQTIIAYLTKLKEKVDEMKEGKNKA